MEKLPGRLVEAVTNGDRDGVHRLLDGGWDVNARDEQGVWPLLAAASRRDSAIMRILIGRGAKSQVGRDGSELHLLAAEDGLESVQSWKLLLAAGASPTSSDQNGVTPVHLACEQGNWSMVEFLFEAHLVQDIDMADLGGDAPLHYAARGGHLQIVEFLLSHGANPLLVGKYGCPAETARMFHYPELAQMIEEWSFHSQPLLYVPFDVRMHVFNLLEPHDLCTVAQVCKALNELSSTDDLWRQYCDPSCRLENGTGYKDCYMSWLRPRLNRYARIQEEAKRHSTTSPPPGYDHLLKLTPIGNSGVGKTCLFTRFCTDEFRLYQIGIGPDFRSKLIDLGGRQLKLQVWDTAGQERFRQLLKEYFRGTHGVVLTFDITSRGSFTSVPMWIDSVRKSVASGGVLPPLLLVGTKIDIAGQREVTSEEGERLARKINAIGYCEVSSLTGAGVTEAFTQLARDALLYAIDPFYADARWHVPCDDLLKSLYDKALALRAERKGSAAEPPQSRCIVQ